MAMKSYPFAGQFTGYDGDGFPRSDRDYTEEDLIRMVADLWLNGVVERNYQPLMVTSSGGMDVRVNYGSIFINGRYGYMDPEEDPDYLTLDPGDAEPRIDLISMRLDLSTKVRAITPVIIRGTPSANPIMPEITRDKVIYDMILAKVYVPADAYNITQDSVTDTRKDRDLCGITHWLVDQVDLETIHSQYNFILEEQLATFNAWLSKRETELDTWFTQNAAAFDEWFAYVKDNLSDDVAYNLLQKTDALEESISKISTAWQQWLNNPIDLNILNAIMLQGSENMGMQIFEANGTFEMVAGRIYKVIVIGGGASGVLNNNNAAQAGINGGTSSFGSYVSAIGGFAPKTLLKQGGNGRNPGGTMGSDGVGVNGGRKGTGSSSGGGGGGGLEFMGKGADPGSPETGGTGGGGYGAGGGGAGLSTGGGGGGSGLINVRIFKATITETVTVTVGKGGDAGGSYGGAGADGAVIVCWDDAA